MRTHEEQIENILRLMEEWIISGRRSDSRLGRRRYYSADWVEEDIQEMRKELKPLLEKLIS